MENCNPITTPMEKDTVLNKVIANDRDERRSYRELVGALMYLAVATRLMLLAFWPSLMIVKRQFTEGRLREFLGI